MDTLSKNNIVKIGGIISSELEFSHEIYEEKFFKFYIEVERLSALTDRLPVIISERLVKKENFKIGKIVYIEGQLRSYNQSIAGKNKLILSIFAKEMQEVEEKEDNSDTLTLNDCNFTGYICKDPIYRRTPLGREISDILLAVNRSYKKSDYIPCILWGRNAKFCRTIPVGSMVKLTGRIQSRTYEKKLEDGTIKPMVAYELSVSKFGLLSEEELKIQKELEEIQD